MKLASLHRWKLVLFCTAVVMTSSTLVFPQNDHSRRQFSAHYSQASICGDYSAIATYGANVALALGTESFDGKGHLTGAAVVNQPGTSTTRSLSNIGLAGTYSVNADGTGKMLLTITLPDGSTPSVIEDFVITKTEWINGVEIATELEDAQETPSAVIDDSSLVIHSYTLRSSPKSCAVHP